MPLTGSDGSAPGFGRWASRWQAGSCSPRWWCFRSLSQSWGAS